jgi:hypothetical protein
MAEYQVAVNKMGPGGSTTVAIFTVYDDGKTDPTFTNPPDMVLVASLDRALDFFTKQAEVAAGKAPRARRTR